MSTRVGVQIVRVGADRVAGAAPCDGRDGGARLTTDATRIDGLSGCVQSRAVDLLKRLSDAHKLIVGRPHHAADHSSISIKGILRRAETTGGKHPAGNRGGTMNSAGDFRHIKFVFATNSVGRTVSIRPRADGRRCPPVLKQRTYTEGCDVCQNSVFRRRPNRHLVHNNG